ncbi:MAG: exodeoxyribonuclease III [Planctomycetota bacterium]
MKKAAAKGGKGKSRRKREKTLTLLSWNVNGIRAIEKKGFLSWLEKTAPDILCLQETKAHPDQLSTALKEPKGYVTAFSAAEKKGYSGTGLYSKTPPLACRDRLNVPAFDTEGRVIIAEFSSFILVTVYVPNGGRECVRVPFKMGFSDALLGVLEDLRSEGKGVAVCGDFNTAHKAVDLARPKENEDHTGFLPEERAWLDKFLGRGYVDTFRHLHPKKTGAYTWWDYRTRARPKNIGWRLDYFFVTADLLPRLRSAFILHEVTGSDHCPVGIELAE